MTFKLCTDFCGNAGFSMAGVEWGRECCKFSISKLDASLPFRL